MATTKSAIKSARSELKRINARLAALPMGPAGTHTSNPAYMPLVKASSALESELRRLGGKSFRETFTGAPPSGPAVPAAQSIRYTQAIPPQGPGPAVASGQGNAYTGIPGNLAALAGKIGAGIKYMAGSQAGSSSGVPIVPPAAGEIQGPQYIEPGTGTPPLDYGEVAGQAPTSLASPGDIPPDSEPFAPTKAPLSALAGPPAPDPSTFLQQAEDTPELAAFKAAINSPPEMFKEVGFSPAERLALGFLAGLKGVESVLPIVEQRRREAMSVYEHAKDVRAERLSGLFQIASLSAQERNRRVEMAQAGANRTESLRRYEEGRNLQERGLKLSERAADRADKEAALKEDGHLLPVQAGTIKDISSAYQAAKTASEFLKKYEGQNIPGSPFTTLGGRYAFGSGQIAARADIQEATSKIKTQIIGSARTLTELQDVSGFLPSFGDRDEVVFNGMRKVKQNSINAIRNYIGTLRATGHDTRGLEAQLAAEGYAGAEVAPTKLYPVPAGVTLDPGYVINDGDYGQEAVAP